MRFRAWSNKENKMLSVAILDMRVGEGIFTFESNPKFRTDIVLMYNTFLKDKNDKLIFENDVVYYKRRHYKVIFEMGAFRLQHIHKDLTPYQLIGNYNITFTNLDLNKIEILGNIFEWNKKGN